MIIDTTKRMPVQMFPTEYHEIINELHSRSSTATMVEWGSGGSTLMWLKNLKPGQRLISIENDQVWAEKLQQQLAEETDLSNFEYLVYPTEQDGATFTPEHQHYLPYVTAKDHVWDADVYLVDGRVRIWCARTVFQQARNRSAVVYCHDYAYNSGWYDQLLAIYPRHEFITTEFDANNEDMGAFKLQPPMMLKLWLS